ncbi:MAG: L,D-transpeptidase [Anaerolineales bacterium]|nr:L,D-transpeptidase [Anaerolineales bacterium]
MLKSLITRRQFLKIGGLGISLALSLFLPSTNKLRERFPWAAELLGQVTPAEALALLNSPHAVDFDQQGRVIDTSITVFDIPSFSGNKVNTYWIDKVLPITAVTVSEDTDSHNRIWYRIGDKGYAHSAAIQPVRTVLNPPNPNIPEGGALAEVTVPYTDARWAAGKYQPVAYRFYYQTTYWVINLVYDQDGEAWYGILDDKWEFTFYTLASHLRLIPAEELTPLSPDVPSSLKRLQVLIPEQLLIAYEWEQPVFMARVATGAKFSNGDYSTPLGRHITFHKRPSRHMAAGNLAANGYDLPGVPWNSYITESGIAFHGTYWHNNFGRPRSHGCINLTPQAARWVFRWTQPVVPPDQPSAYEQDGTVVDITD